MSRSASSRPFIPGVDRQIRQNPIDLRRIDLHGPHDPVRLKTEVRTDCSGWSG